MDSDRTSKASSLVQLGKNILQNPQDICYISNNNSIAVADESNGLIILSEKGQLIKVSFIVYHLPKLKRIRNIDVLFTASQRMFLCRFSVLQ